MRVLIILLSLVLLSSSIYAQESSIQIISIDTASQGIVKVVVKNTGIELDTVTVYGTCQDNKASIYENREISIQPGQSVPANLPISFGSGASTTCTIHAEGVLYSDSEQFTAIGNVLGKECTPSSIVCHTDGNIKQCNNEGFWAPYQTCQYGCLNDKAGKPYCDARSLKKSGLVLTIIILIFILAFIGYLLKRKKSKTLNKK